MSPAVNRIPAPEGAAQEILKVIQAMVLIDPTVPTGTNETGLGSEHIGATYFQKASGALAMALDELGFFAPMVTHVKMGFVWIVEGKAPKKLMARLALRLRVQDSKGTFHEVSGWLSDLSPLSMSLPDSILAHEIRETICSTCAQEGIRFQESRALRAVPTRRPITLITTASASA